ncbi:PREDICTED: 4F2 cell-surface antigen heavy chain [Sturnus vulgaris]|uniref:4F2 cell-surface antigen heavy chain n=1 Tax=Sturnus vulgaris TaxID=9172 RepID=UPI00071A9101|nr:PREDICTED: 4F2 cell-surface antigen heavy chain [Sturnus vulgaris]
MDPESPPRELELSALEAEKEPMAAAAEPDPELGTPPQAPSPHRDPVPGPESRPGGEKNGLVMKIPPEEEEEAALAGAGVSGSPKFTGLGKEELLREAGTPLWARARLVLLILFWGGWIGMLGAAAAIVAQAPRCQPLPNKGWWELGALYRAPPEAFGGNLKGVEKRLGYLKEKLQVGGLVLGPVYPPKLPDDKIPALKELDPALGTFQDFTALLEAAKDKGLKVILDLTPNPSGDPVWGEAAKDPEVLEQVKAALTHWLKQDIAGIFLDGIEELQASLVAEWRNLTEQEPSPSGVARVLVGGTRLQEPWKVPRDPWGPQLLLGPFLKALEPKPEMESPEGALRDLLNFLSFNSSVALGWSVGSPWEAWVSPNLRLQQLLLLWGLPGTPVLSYGDELGMGRPLRNQKLESMRWGDIEGFQNGSDGAKPPPELELCTALASLRARERSLLLGEARVVPAGSAIAVLRFWDQNERFLLVLNPHGTDLKPFSVKRPPGEAGTPALPPQMRLRYSSSSGAQGGEQQLQLEEMKVAPYEGVLLSFPYSPE